MSPIRGSTSSRSPKAIKATPVTYDSNSLPSIRKSCRAPKWVTLSWDPFNYHDPFDLPWPLATIIIPDSHLDNSYNPALAATKTEAIDEQIQHLTLQMSALDVEIAAAIEEEARVRAEAMAEIDGLGREIKRGQDKIRCLERCLGEREISFVVAGKKHTLCCREEEFCGDIETREI